MLRALLVAIGLLGLALPAAAQTGGGARLRDCPECPEMTVVPAGRFTMGTPANERGRDEAEGPQHDVSVGAFMLGVHPVTFEEWDACVAAGGCNGYLPDDQDWGRARHPVITASWDDAQSYVRWLSERTGRNYRLPSEAEWEYAARAGTTTVYWWGDEIGYGHANCTDCGGQWDGQQTQPVGSFPANPFGLHDMLGNVWQWVEDCWNDGYLGAPDDGSAWTIGNCRARVIRGGGWDNNQFSLRSGGRLWAFSGQRSIDIGFRVARAVDP
jgi:formylglycine-generating enzyme required for sulfatase activity